MSALLHRPLHLWMVRHRLLLFGLLGLAGVAVLVAVGTGLRLAGPATSGESTGVAPAQPQLLPSPVHSAGDGWELDVYVSNLQELDLALVAGLEGARLGLALVDLPSGQTAASGTFGTDPHVRLRQDPLQLLVSNGRESGRDARLLIFDLDGQDIALAATLELPERNHYRGGLANGMMVLSGDGRYLFVSQYTRVDTPGCKATNYADSEVCTHSNIGVIDLNQPTEVTPVPLPFRCASSVFSPIGDQSLMVGCRGLRYVVRADNATSDRLTSAYPSVHAPAAAEQGSLFYVRFLTQLPNGAMRAVRGDGVVFAEPGEVLDAGLLPEGHHVVHVERIDDSRVLIMAGRGRAGSQLITKLLVVDIEGPSVLYSVDAPAGFVSAAPIDDARAVLLIHDAGAELLFGDRSGGDALSGPSSLDSPGAFVIRELDLTSGELGESIMLQGLPSDPAVILGPGS